MSEFKGTRGKWEARLKGKTASAVYCDNTQICIRARSTTEVKADMLLISKAPEMLEMLNILLYDYKNYIQNISQDSHRNNRINEIEQLIKQATEL